MITELHATSTGASSFLKKEKKEEKKEKKKCQIRAALLKDCQNQRGYRVSKSKRLYSVKIKEAIECQNQRGYIVSKSLVRMTSSASPRRSRYTKLRLFYPPVQCGHLGPHPEVDHSTLALSPKQLALHPGPQLA